MGEDLVTYIGVKDFDLVFLKAARGTEVEVARVLITKGDILDFSALAPIGSFFIIFGA
jgi:hypothetical protein